MIVDFSGASPQQPTNFNAPLSVCRAAALHVFRTLVRDPIPLEEGCPRPLEIRAPKGSLPRPEYPAAVAAGNVETSQRIALRRARGHGRKVPPFGMAVTAEVKTGERRIIECFMAPLLR
uniref:Hydantoinase B/oxoprolinase n=1 Tax=Candidatus Kentrum sp. TC TaxID=2126339 RepID=A0A450ZTW4_9GAMM|nr:MAG: Hydantoinase B/oxoprolinase [Candidatus Kentron sp. TC]